MLGTRWKEDDWKRVDLEIKKALAEENRIQWGGHDMGAFKTAMTVQAVILLLYGLPLLLVPRWWTEMTQQPPVPENYILRAIGIPFIILAWLEFKIVGDLGRYRDLTLIFGLLSALFFVTIVGQAFWRGFHGAPWYWWCNGIISGVLAIAVLGTRHKARSEVTGSA